MERWGGGGKSDASNVAGVMSSLTPRARATAVVVALGALVAIGCAWMLLNVRAPGYALVYVAGIGACLQVVPLLGLAFFVGVSRDAAWSPRRRAVWMTWFSLAIIAETLSVIALIFFLTG